MRPKACNNYFPGVEEGVDAFLGMEARTKNDILCPTFDLRPSTWYLLDVDAAIVVEELVGEALWEAGEVRAVRDDKAGCAALHQREERALVEPVDDVLDRGELVATRKVLEDKGDEEEDGRQPAEAEFLLQGVGWKDVDMEVAAAVEEVVGPGGDLAQDGSEPWREPTDRGNRVELVLAGERGDGVDVDVVIRGDIVRQGRKLVLRQDEVHLALSGEATRHLDGDLGVAAHRTGRAQSECEDDEAVLHGSSLWTGCETIFEDEWSS